MAITKKRNESTETRLLLEDDGPVELPPAEVEESKVLVQFDTFKPFIHELLEELRAGTMVEPVPVMLDGSTFVVHGATRSFWVKLWHSSPERTRIERAQVLSCLPSTRGVQVFIGDPEDDEDYLEDDDYLDEDEDADDGDGALMTGDEDEDDVNAAATEEDEDERRHS
ncbi:MAG TPA: hypothetical protein VF666_17330 [Pyrinomonadaceae bacterium]|jgi:hypothetical protein